MVGSFLKGSLMLILGVLLYLWALVSAQESLLNVRSHEILSLPIALFPLFYVALIIMVTCTVWASARKDWRIASASALFLGLMIWLTPYVLSFMPRFPVTLFYARAAMSFNQLFSADTTGFTLYAKSYPASFAYDYVLLSVTGIDAFTYARVIYPAVAVLATLLLWFSFCSRVVGRWVAPLATLLAFPGLHYVEFHLSPHSAGVILVLTVFLLSRLSNRGATVLTMVSILTLVLAHPIAPIIVALYWAGIALATFRRQGSSSASLGKIAYVIVAWLGWIFFHSVAYGTALVDAYQLVMSDLIGSLQQTVVEAGGRAGNIYPEIPFLHTATVLTYVLAAVLVSLVAFRHRWTSLVRILTRDRARLQGRVETQVAVATALFAVFAILLGLQDPSLRERSLFYFVLFASAFTVSCLFNRSGLRIRRMGMLFLVVWICMLVTIYPLVSYYGENYASPLFSEGTGMNFLSHGIDLNGKTVSMQYSQELVYYSGYKSYDDYGFPPQIRNDEFSPPEIIMFRESAFFFFATRIDLSLMPKTYMDSYTSVSSLALYDMVYASSTIRLFVVVPSNASSTNLEKSLEEPRASTLQPYLAK